MNVQCRALRCALFAGAACAAPTSVFAADDASAAIGVDNFNNRDYFVFHPFPQRSVLADLRYVY